MGFQNPYFLFGLFALLIPIVVHFFNFHRFKKVYFTNVSVLKEIEVKTKKTNNIYKWLLLFFRCLTIIFLCFLFAQPYLKNDEKALVKEGGNTVVVFVDNSFSSPLDKAKVRAKEIVEMYEQTDKFCLLTMDLAGKERHFVDRDRFCYLLSQIEHTPSSRMMSQVYNTAHKLLENQNGNNKICYFVSDFQKSCLDEENFKQDSIENVFVGLERDDVNNIFVDSLWCENKSIIKGTSVELRVRVRNSSQQDVEKVPLKLFVDNKQVAIASVDLKEDESKVFDLSFNVESNGILHSKVSIMDSPVVFDNDYYFTILVEEKVKVLSLNQREENPYLMRLFSDEEQVVVDNYNLSNPPYNDFNNYSLIVLNEIENIKESLAQELKKYVENVGSLLVVPSLQMDVKNVNTFLISLSLPYFEELKKQPMRVNVYDKDNFLFKGVFSQDRDDIFLPNVKMYYPIKTSAQSASQGILSYSNSDDFLVVSPKTNSNVYLFSVGLDTVFSDFVNNSLFVPILWNICVLSQQTNQLYHIIGEDEIIPTPFSQQPLVVKGVSDSTEVIGQMIKNQKGYALKLYNQINKSGNYNIISNGKVVSGFSLNYSQKESIMEFADKKQMSKQFQNYSIEKKLPFSYLFILFALLTIIIETILMYKLNKIKK